MDPVLCSGKVDKLPINVTVNHEVVFLRSRTPPRSRVNPRSG